MAAPSPPPLPRSFKRSAPSERERESSPVSRLTGKKVIARLEATRHRPRTSFAPLHHHPFLPSFLDIANVSPSSVGERPSTPRFHSRNTHIHIHSSRHTAANTQREGKRPHTHTAAADAQQQTHREKKRDHTHTHTHNTERAANTQREEERPHTHTRAHRGRAVAVVPNPFSSPPPPLFVLRPCLPDFFPACFHFPSVEDEKKNFHFLRRIDRFCVWFDLEMNRNLDRLSREGR